MAQGAHSDVSQIAEVNLQLLLIGILRILHCMGHHDGHHGHYFSNQNDPTLLHLGRLFRPFLVGPRDFQGSTKDAHDNHRHSKNGYSLGSNLKSTSL